MTSDSIRSTILTLRRLWRRLGVRLVLFLMLALTPLALVAVVQTRSLVEKTRAEARAYLTDRTRTAAQEERDDIMRALGIAEGLAPFLLSSDPGSASCRDRLSALANTLPGVATIGYMEADGRVRCASNGTETTLADTPRWPGVASDPRARVRFIRDAPVSGAPVIVAMAPILVDGAFRGYAFVSQPHDQLVADMRDSEGADFITFNADGEILTTTAETPSKTGMLPEDRSLSDLTAEVAISFPSPGRDGTWRSYAVIPIIPGIVYAIGIWPEDTLRLGPLSTAWGVPLFPVIIGLTSLAVAYVAVHRLVVRHIRKLRSHMRGFVKNRHLSPPSNPEMSQEIADIFDTFHHATETIIRDEAEMEQMMREKTVLLREVHHRVKNNLQLISSIMNMQLRKVRTAEARRVVSHLQSRVLSLATVHRNLYRTSDLGAVNGGALLEQLVSQLVALAGSEQRAVSISTQFDPVVLYPDQAVPVSLLTAEAVTNALKYMGASHGAEPRLSVCLRDLGDGRARLSIGNTKGPEGSLQGEDDPGSGLGSGLMNAFASQLESRLEIEDTEDRYDLSCVFTLQDLSGLDDDGADPASDGETEAA